MTEDSRNTASSGRINRAQFLQRAATAREAERLRRSFEPEVILVIGCEFMLFTPGIVQGKDFYERVAYLTKGEFDFAELQRKLAVYVAKAVAVARRNFQANHLTNMLQVFEAEGMLGASAYDFVSPNHRMCPIPGTTWTSLRSACAR